MDEAFADCLPGEPAALANQPKLTGIVVIRSLTKTWGRAGLRAGYVLAAPDVIAQLATGQPPWPVSAPALTACIATASAAALREAADWARQLASQRAHLYGLIFLNPVKVVLDDAPFPADAGGRLRSATLRRAIASAVGPAAAASRLPQLMYLVIIQSVTTARLGNRQRWQAMLRVGVFADLEAGDPAITT